MIKVEFYINTLQKYTDITTGPDETTVSLNGNKVMKHIIGSPQIVKYILHITITQLIKKQYRYY